MVEHGMRDGCVVRFENTNKDLGEIKKTMESFSTIQIKTREELIINTITTERLATALEKIGINMENGQKTNLEIQKNLYHLNEGYQRLESGQIRMADEFNKRIDQLQKEVLEKGNDSDEITEKLIDTVVGGHKTQNEIKLLNRKEIWGLLGIFITVVGAIVVAYLK